MGQNYFGDWIRSLDDPSARYKIFVRLGWIKREGNFGDHRSVGDGIWELRINYGPGYRVYYGLDGDRVVVLLAGGHKDSQDADIKTAKRRWKQRDARERSRS